MSFTDEERRQWRDEKAKREHKPHVPFRAEPVATCVHCYRPFGYGEGTITDDISLCDQCDSE